MGNNKVKLLDIQFDLELVNLSEISKSSPYSFTYVRHIVLGIKNGKKAQKVIRDTIVRLYSDLIKFDTSRKR